jgi:hypothetical protein
LSIADWTGIQSGFAAGVKDASDWAWSKAHDLVYDRPIANDDGVSKNDGDETQQTIWQRLKADEHSFSRLTGLIEVCHCVILDSGELWVGGDGPWRQDRCCGG